MSFKSIKSILRARGDMPAGRSEKRGDGVPVEINRKRKENSEYFADYFDHSAKIST
jgi:hypothetical protein